MESTTPTTTTSETDSGAAVTQGTPGTVNDGAGAGSQAAADTFAAERETFETQRRALQSERDRLKAELDKLKSGAATPATPAPTETALTAESVMALLKKDREMTALAADLKGQFPLSDPALFQSYESFDNADSFRVAVENSHNSVKARVEAETQPAITAAVEAAIAPYVQKYGRLAETPQTPEGATAIGLPTIAEVSAMTTAEMDALAEKHGDDVIDRILRSA